MFCVRKEFKKLQEKAKQEKARSKRSWKPIMDRKRTSPGTRRSRSDESLSSDNSSAYVTSFDSDRSAGDVYDENRMENSIDNTKKKSKPSTDFVTSTPFTVNKAVLKSVDRKNVDTLNEANKENLKKRPLNAKGRPNMSNLSPKKRKRRSSEMVAMETSDEKDDSCVSPVKKKKTEQGFVVTQEDLTVGDGIVTRRRLPRVELFSPFSVYFCKF